ncbi:MAG: methyltransferase domain-containing protein [Polyangiaceae bacterium]|nr:methyltransferase domain-containing protein [Polyangiaceae bacterium]
MSWWDRRVLPFLVEKACRTGSIRRERERRVPQASGRVLEIGVGTGLNLAFYDPSRVTELVAIDPAPALLERARARAGECRAPLQLLPASATALPFDAGSFESVVMTYTLCSVDDPGRALAEMRRVLGPGGRLLFVEHGRSPRTVTRAVQRALTPGWRRISGNCHLDRDVPRSLREAGFRLDELDEHAGDGPSWAGHTFEGVAVVDG